MHWRLAVSGYCLPVMASCARSHKPKPFRFSASCGSVTSFSTERLLHPQALWRGSKLLPHIRDAVYLAAKSKCGLRDIGRGMTNRGPGRALFWSDVNSATIFPTSIRGSQAHVCLRADSVT